MSRVLTGWHFLPSDRRLRYGDGREVVPGEWLRADGEIRLCESGMHASRTLLQALRYAPGPVVCRVEVRGDLVIGDDKFAGRERRVLWMYDATNVLHDFARRCACDVLHLWDAPDVVVRYLRTGDEEIRAAARAAAGAAARAAARAARGAAADAAWAASADAACAARGAAADAAWAASADAAWAARGAAAGAAWAASADAAWAARGAARAAKDAAWDKQRRRLTSMICAHRPESP